MSRVVEGSGVGAGGCVVHVDVYGNGTEHGRYHPPCMQKL